MIQTKRFFVFAILSLLLLPRPEAQPSFTRVTVGDIVNTPSDSRSVNFVDVNNDGWEDVFISNGPSTGQDNMLYLNNGDQSFTTQTDDPIVMDNGKSDGATFADVDNDGDLDAFVVTWHGQRNFFYRNNGDGTFMDENTVTPATGGTHSETASWGDYDGDGWVDLFVTNSYNNLRNQLFHNDTDGDFSLVTGQNWLTQSDPSRCVSWTDYDLDGDLDLFVSNEGTTANDFLRNDGNGLFTPITNVSIVQSMLPSMSASWADIDNDGDFDLFIANAGYYQEKNNQLFRNNADGTFTEITVGDAIGDGGCSYGSSFADADNDGDLDLLVANGFCNSHLEDRLYENDGNGVFTYVPDALPDMSARCSFGAAFGDVNNDGFMDLAIANCKNTSSTPQPANTFYLNDGNENHWLKVKLEGTESNRSAIGAKVKVKAQINGNAVWQIREISAQTGYCGQNSLIAHFGLGEATIVDSLLVFWPSGQQSLVIQQAVDVQLNLLEGFTDQVRDRATLFPLEWNCSPNPVQDVLQIDLKWPKNQPAGPLHLSVIDSLGRIVDKQWVKENTNTFKIPMEAYPAGNYRVVLRMNGDIDSRLIVKL